MNQTDTSFDDSSLDILRKLVKVLMPLDAWIEKKTREGGYKPPNAADLPWRVGDGPLTTDKLAVVEFLVAVIRESDSDRTLLERWHMIQADPLKYCPVENKDEWRNARGLYNVPRFGIDATENMPSDDSGRQMVRSQIYADYLPLLVVAARAAKPATDEQWNKFAVDLFSDTCDTWSQGSRSYRSSKFMLQLLRDVLYATLGMRNQVKEPWRSAVLTEIGEFRRPGNVFTRKNIEDGLREFESVLRPESRSEATINVSREGALMKEGSAVGEARPRGRSRAELSDSVRDYYLEFNKRHL
jgi:hypothetical protein